MCTSRRRGRISRRERWVTSVPRMRIVPAVGSTRRAMQLPTVDLPLPDSPTSPRSSPGPIVRDTPSTARTMPPPPMSCGPTWKCLTRPSTSRTGGGAVIRSLDGSTPRGGRAAPRAAAGPPSVSGWSARGQRSAKAQYGSGSANRGTSPGISCSRVDASAGDRAQEADRVRMLRVLVQLVDGCLFGLAAGVHHDHAIGDVGDDAEVVRDQHDRGAETVADVAHQVEDPGLDGHVERGGRLVGDQDLRVAGERDRDHHPLAHPARELVRILVHPRTGRGDPHEVEQLHGSGTRGATRVAEVALQHLGHLAADGERGVEGRHRLLEHEGDLAAADPLELRVRRGQQVGVAEPSGAADDCGRRQEPEQREHRHRLAAPGLADHAEHLALDERERELVDRLGGAVVGLEAHREVAHVQQRGRHQRVVRGSRASRSPSPSRLNASAQRKIASPGYTARRGACER